MDLPQILIGVAIYTAAFIIICIAMILEVDELRQRVIKLENKDPKPATTVKNIYTKHGKLM